MPHVRYILSTPETIFEPEMRKFLIFDSARLRRVVFDMPVLISQELILTEIFVQKVSLLVQMN